MPSKPSATAAAPSRFAGQVAIVTGGGGGIGEVIAARLASEGAAVAILELDPVKGEEVAKRLSAHGYRILFLHCDVTDREQIRQAVETVSSAFGPVKILINNAGIGMRAPFLDLTDDTWNKVLSVNLTGAFIVAQEVCRHMVENGGGSVVNMASTAAQMANSEQVVYSVSKAGLEALTRVMAFELAPLGIRVNAVAPGTIATSFLSAMLTEEAKAERVRRIPAGRFGSAEEVASVVAFLASSDAQYVTACSLPIDGGLLPAGIRT
jgi:NAD(P)-dependent dehydrogenase (short-subunit alcohol dehydrogenase family)